MFTTRRALLAAALAPIVAPVAAHAQGIPAPAEWLRAHPGFAAWETPPRPADRLMNARIDTGGSRITTREWLGGRPTVLAVWATWCAPCLVEKRPEAILDARLQAAGSRTQVKALLAFDTGTLAESRTVLERLGASTLGNAQATDVAEQSLLWTFGFDRERRSRSSRGSAYSQLSTVLPFTLLLDGNGGLLGRSTGVMRDAQRRSYWETPEAFDMLQRLGQA
jgi:thiol-disulfide isomerase/thioredoxin